MSKNIIELNESNFEDTLEETSKPLVIDFWAEWCGPCKQFTPIFEEVAKENEDKFTFAKVDIDTQAELAKRHNVRSIPTVVIFKDGEVKNQITGAKSKAELKSYLHIHE